MLRKPIIFLIILSGSIVGAKRPTVISASSIRESSGPAIRFLQVRQNLSGPNCANTSPAAGCDMHGAVGSMNSQINVMAAPYNAKGDCVTDDSAAITAAQAAAITFAVGNATPAALYFPKPPGGCYLTSTIEWAGVSLIGQPSGTGLAAPATYGVTIKGRPGKDILHVPDPTTARFTWYPSWTIRDVSFLVDDRTSPSFPHRWPGRWFDDGAMTSGSNEFRSTNGFIGCGDIGQAIKVDGAGPSGKELVTTIASVTPCWSNSPISSVRAWQKVTLAANASTTVSNAHTYIAVIGDSAAKNVGNCAIAMDDKDGNSADWVNPHQQIGSNGSSMENVSFNVTGGNFSNPACAVYTQGAHELYALRVRNFGIYSSAYGILQGTAELNSFYSSSAGDFEIWEHGFINNYEPWISYNGGENELRDIELTVDAGPQILGVNNRSFDYANTWTINIQEFEAANSPTTYGMRITGSGHTLNNTMLAAGGGMTANIESTGLTCNSCSVGNTSTIELDGSQNIVNGPAVGTKIVDYGRGNQVYGIYNASPLNGLPTTQPYSWLPLKGRSDLIGKAYMPDFLRDGNPNTTYKASDLWIWPQDFEVGNQTAYSDQVQVDTESPAGYDFVFPAGYSYHQFTQFAATSDQIVLGTVIPQAPAIVYASLKCPKGVNQFSFHIVSSGGYMGGANNVTCTTSLATYTFPVNFIGQTGFVSIANAGSNPFYAAWIYFQPNQSVNGLSPTGAGAALPTGPTRTKAHDLAVYSDDLGTMADASVGLPLSVTSGSIGGSALAPGACASASIAGFTGVKTTMVATASPNTYPGDGFVWKAYIPSNGSVTVKVCAIVAGTPTASTYNVRVIQ